MDNVSGSITERESRRRKRLEAMRLKTDMWVHGDGIDGKVMRCLLEAERQDWRPIVTNLTVRDVDREIAQALKVRAAANGRSAEAEHRIILREALAPSQARAEDFAAAAARLRARLRHDGDSGELVRAARDGRPDAKR